MEFFWQVFELHHVLVLFIGLLLGIVIGALPGLTPTMGVALMIPFTFSLGPTDAYLVRWHLLWECIWRVHTSYLVQCPGGAGKCSYDI